MELRRRGRVKGRDSIQLPPTIRKRRPLLAGRDGHTNSPVLNGATIGVGGAQRWKAHAAFSEFKCVTGGGGGELAPSIRRADGGDPTTQIHFNRLLSAADGQTWRALCCYHASWEWERVDQVGT